MTPRDTLDGVILDLEINNHPNAGNGRAALRELDLLLKDFADHYSLTECSDNCEHCRELKAKAAQAGYGEK